MKIPYQIDFTRPETNKDVAPYIGIEAELFEKIISSNDRTEFYFKHEIPKRGRNKLGKCRVVWEANPFTIWRLAEAHKAFARRFDLFARLVDANFPHGAAFGYVRGRGTQENAKQHCGARLLLRADVKEFFESITARRLADRFIELGIKSEPANALATFATINDRLALGLNASPMLANLVCVDLDIKIQALAQKYQCTYTRYADDIAISGVDALPPRSELQKILFDEGFQLNDEKFRITKIGQAHYVTGLSISDRERPHVPRTMKRRLRQELYYCEKYGIDQHLLRVQSEDDPIQIGVNRLDGSVHYVSYHEAKSREQLKSKWQKLLQRDGLGPNFEPRSQLNKLIRCYVDESEISFEDKRYLALGLVFTEDFNRLLVSTIATLREHNIEDPFYAGDRSAIEAKGLHFADSHFDLRASYIKVLSTLSYRAFIIYGRLNDDSEYAKTYLRLLECILRDRLIWYDGISIDFEFEENSKIVGNSLRELVERSYQLLQSPNSRRPIKVPSVHIRTKQAQPCFAAPDYLLGVFARYAQLNEKPDEKTRLHQFERLRDKYRLIVDADSGTEYSRRRPFEPWIVAAK